MRRWMRDRGKRRKQQAEKQGQENPAPLQPKFPEPAPDEAESRQPDFEAQAATPEAQVEAEESRPESQAAGSGEEPAQQQQLRRDRSRRRGRRGRGGRPQTPAQAPALPGPGGPTGEAAEAGEGAEIAEPACSRRSACANVPENQRRSGAVHRFAGLGQEYLVQASQHSAAFQ